MTIFSEILQTMTRIEPDIEWTDYGRTYSIASDIMPLITPKKIKFIMHKLQINFDNGPWLAGGSVRKMFHNEEIGCSDWDVFCMNVEQYTRAFTILRELNLSLMADTIYASTFKFDDHIVQLIKHKYYPTVHALLDNFDFSICQFATDGYHYVHGQYSIEDYDNNRIRYMHQDVREHLISRIMKYRIYGFYMDAELVKFIDDNISTINFHKPGLEYDF